MRFAAAQIDRDACVRDDADRFAGALYEVADRLAHLLGPGRAVEPDDVSAEAFENGEGGAYVGAEEHAAVRIERYLDLQWEGPAHLGKGASGAQHRGFGFEDVLLSLDDQQIGAAFEESSGL